MIKRGQTYLTDISGGIIVEAALILPFLVTAGLGALDASYMMVQNHRLENQLSLAATYISKSDTPDLRETPAIQLAVTGDISGQGNPTVKGWKVEDVSIEYLTTSNIDGAYRGETAVRTVKLSTRFDYKGFGILSSILPETPTLAASVQERIVGGGL